MGDEKPGDIIGGDSPTIKVCMRVRPFIREEIEGTRSGGHIELCIGMPTTTTVEMLGRDEPRSFEFDRCYWSHNKDHPLWADQQTLQDELGQSMITSALNGYNNCIFAYGQTGSGKSFSVLGGKGELRGLLPRVVEGLFERFAELDESIQKKTEVSFIEIYNEQIRDLFAVKEEGKELPKLDVKQHPVLGTIIPGLTESPVASAEDVMGLVDYGTTMRQVAETAMNAASSRSHCIFTFKTSVSEPNGVVKISGTNLVDLAGSERAGRTKATGQRLKEGVAINQSLSVLATVIRELAKQSQKKKSNPPFRGSKLTYILKESLSGNSRTVMMAAISPSSADYDETLSTMNFAKSVKQIQTKAVSNAVNEKGVEAALRLELDELRAKLAQMEAGGMQMASGEGGGGGGGVAMMPVDPNLQRRLQEQEQLCKWFGKNWEDIVAEEKQRQKKRAALLRHDSVLMTFRDMYAPVADPEADEETVHKSDEERTEVPGDEQLSDSDDSMTDNERRLSVPLVHLFKPGEDESEEGRTSLRVGTPSSIAVVGPKAASCKTQEAEVELRSQELRRLRHHAARAQEAVGHLSKEGAGKLKLRVVIGIEPGEAGEQMSVEVLVHALHTPPPPPPPPPPPEPEPVEGGEQATDGEAPQAEAGEAEKQAPAEETDAAGAQQAGEQQGGGAQEAQPPGDGEEVPLEELEPEETSEWISEETLMKRLRWLKMALVEDNFDQSTFGGDAWLAAIDGVIERPPPPPEPELPAEGAEEEEPKPEGEEEPTEPPPEPEPEKPQEPPWMALQRSQAREIARLNEELLTAHDEISKNKGRLKKERVAVQELREELSAVQEELASARAKLKMGAVMDTLTDSPDGPRTDVRADARLQARLEAAKEELARKEKEAAKQSNQHMQALADVRMESANFARVLTMTFDNAIHAIDEAQSELDRLGLQPLT